jgi:hypothetical protein
MFYVSMKYRAIRDIVIENVTRAIDNGPVGDGRASQSLWQRARQLPRIGSKVAVCARSLWIDGSAEHYGGVMYNRTSLQLVNHELSTEDKRLKEMDISTRKWWNEEKKRFNWSLDDDEDNAVMG